MFSRFTASARRVMQRAFREAKRSQHDFVGTEHLLYGLLCDAEGSAVVLLRTLPSAPELMLAKVERLLRQHGAEVAMERFPLSPASRRSIQRAGEEALAFQHQMIAQEHLLLGLLHEPDSEAAQILSEFGVSWKPVRNAIARTPPDAHREAQIQANQSPRVSPGDNPSVDELERWLAPDITVHEMTQNQVPGASLSTRSGTLLGTSRLDDIEAQVQRTQLVFGSAVSYAFGHWLYGWRLGLALGVTGFLVANFRKTWLGVAFGGLAGVGLPLFFHPELRNIAALLAIGMMGSFLGSFLGDGWRFSRTAPGRPAPRHNFDSAAEESPGPHIK